jgi:type IX secretion system PorP/SprF family membrane protein
MKKKCFLIAICIVCYFAKNKQLSAQMDPQFTSNMFTRQLVNPASVGETEMANAFGNWRRQWKNVGPVTYAAYFDTPLQGVKRKHGAALSIISDQAGLFTTTSINLAYAHKQDLWNGRLSVGVQGSLINSVFAGDMVESVDDLTTDYHGNLGYPQITTEMSGVKFDIALGLHYSDKDQYYGVSLTHLARPTLEINETGAYIYYNRTLNLYGGYNYNMKNILNCLAIVASIIFASSCSNSTGNGELYGEATEAYHEMLPYGMVYIPSGSFMMGPNDQSAFFITSKQNKQVNVEKFWMDETEITNTEYHQFITWLKDHLTRLEIYQNQVGMESDAFAKQTEEGDIIYIDEENNIPEINYEQEIDMRDIDIKEFLDTLFYTNNPFEGKVLRTEKLNYQYTEIDLLQASKKINQFDPVTARYKTKNRTDKDLIRKDTAYVGAEGIVRETNYVQLSSRNDFFITRNINIYPDTLCWMRNFTYSFNEPYTLYFSHPGYAEYPVVGVSWEQAKAFCNWRTKLKNDYLESIHQAGVQA